MTKFDSMIDDTVDAAFRAMSGGPFDCLEELSNVIADAANDGYTESEGSFVIAWRGVDLKITVSVDKED